MTEEITRYIISKIPQYRSRNISIEDIITKVVLSRYSYPMALKYFLESNVTDMVILTIGMNRDGLKHDRCYILLYKELKKVYLQRRRSAIPDLLQTAKSIKNKPGTLWRKLLFKHSAATTFNDLVENEFTTVNTEEDL